jgi:hypothetical protein
MKTTAIYSILKRAHSQTVSVVKSRTPDLAPTFRKIAASLQKAYEAVKADDFYTGIPPESVTFPMQEVVAQAALVQGDVCSNRDDLVVAKSISPEEFVSYVNEEISAVLAETDAPKALAKAYSLKGRIEKSMRDFASLYASPADADAFVFYKEEPTEAQAVAKAAQESIAKGEKAPAPGPWSTGEVAFNKGAVDVAAVQEATSGAISKSATQIASGWSHDLNTKTFLDGDPLSVDFGADAKKL